MRESLKEVVDNNLSAVMLHVTQDTLQDTLDFIASYEYPVEVFNSSGDLGTVKLGFINGLNEYHGSEEFIKNRILSELSAVNHIFDINIDEHYLNYLVEWIHNLHVMDTPLNYLDNDNALFDFLINFFEDRHYESNSPEDEVAIKFLRVVEEFLYSEEELPIMNFRDRLFNRPSILIVAEENPLKVQYIAQIIKDYYDEFLVIEEKESTLAFMKVQN